MRAGPEQIMKTGLQVFLFDRGFLQVYGTVPLPHPYFYTTKKADTNI
jgi:hypothetical protein